MDINIVNETTLEWLIETVNTGQIEQLEAP
jgi:hypothetical protein